MAGTTIWKGIVTFGETRVNVKLHTAVKEERIRFHLLHRSDLVRLRQQMICAYEKIPVTAAEQVKGFEMEDGKFLVVDPEELEQTTSENSRIIEVHEFVDRVQIDPVYYEHTYYLEPETSPAEYNALVEVLSEMDLVGICTWIMRKRSYFGALQAKDKILRLSTLRYADEVIAANSLALETVPLSEREINIGRELINQLTSPFLPQKFSNEHEKKLQRLIEKKARGETIKLLPPKRPHHTTADELLQALEEGLRKAA